MINAPYRKQPSERRYIDSAELEAEVRSCIENDRTVSEKLGKYFQMIIEHMFKSQCFKRYSIEWKDEMRSYAIYKLMCSIKTVDLSKCANVFNYFSRTTYLAFLTEISKLKKHYDIIQPKQDV